MNIAIIGYGRMGHEIESAALGRGHAVKLIVDKDNMDDLNERSTRDVDVAIEFTTPETAFENVVKCLRMKIPVVSGTTGWLNDYDKAVDVCNENRTSFIHSTNFSIGVNILFRLNRELAGYMSRLEQYKPFIEEIHHIKKEFPVFSPETLFWYLLSYCFHSVQQTPRRLRGPARRAWRRFACS